jgi:heterodisulfide reductase subunit A
LNRGVVVIGAGIGGIQVALDLANAGVPVSLVERQPSIGGVMAALDKTFPTNDCSMCILSPKLVEVARHPNIELLTNSDVVSVEGQAGDFLVRVRRRPRYVDMERCIACGNCSEKCPVKVPSEFDEGLATRKAIYVQFPQAVPLKYAIDPEVCLFLTKEKCGVCAKVCPADAVVFDQEEEMVEIPASSIVVATGFRTYDPSDLKEFGYGVHQNVITNIEFERMLTASGPTDGHVVRPSDGQLPLRIAFLQCVGSRDERAQRWCSSFCCMAAIKEAIIAQEHAGDIEELNIFFMDVRAMGKEFEDYYERAKDQHGIGFTRCRVPRIDADPTTGNLFMNYVDEVDSLMREREFDLVVLSVGMRPPEGAEELFAALGVDQGEGGFCSTDPHTSIDTGRPGVFVCGAIAGPKDIPETVAQASGAAAMAAAVHLRGGERVQLEEDLPEERDVAGEEPRIGVFVCHCGTNIAGVVDVPAVVEHARQLPGVVHAEDNVYSCSADAQELIKERIHEHDLNRVVVASCTPRTHEPLFRSTVREAGLNPYLFDLANIRDQCSWVHQKEPEAATEKSKDLVTMAVSRANLLSPLEDASISVIPKALVVGGGPAGITAALGIADQGFDVHLVERERGLGGNLRNIHNLLGDGDPQDLLDRLVTRVQEHPRVTVHLGRTIESISGYVGNFSTALDDGTQLEHGVVVVATGGRELKPSEYLYGEDDRVLTQHELEDRLAQGESEFGQVTMIQCVGSRNEERPYCSRVCCSTAVKNAIAIKEVAPDTPVNVLHRDFRTYGFKEDYYRRASELGVNFVRFDDDRLPEVRTTPEGIEVEVEDMTLRERILLTTDLLVLSSAILPQADNELIAKMLKVPLSKDGFFLEAHMKLRPLDFATEGVFVCGMAHWPKTVEEAMAQAYGVSARAATILSLPTLEAEGIVSSPDPELCRGCGRCVEVCEYGAPSLVESSEGVFISEINEVLCKGCGTCAVACPTKAITMRHFSTEQIGAMLEALLKGVS